jgi:hypothetical protein
MNEMIFDANFLVALVDEQDVWHSKAVTLLNVLRIKGGEGCLFGLRVKRSNIGTWQTF